MTTKTCTKCNEEKSLDQFFRDSRNTGSKGKGVAAMCKECSQQKKRDWVKDNAEYSKQYQQDYYQRNKDEKWKRDIYKKYGITPKQYDEMLVKQDGKCAICGTTKPRGNGRFHVDHDHETGKVRGLLCHGCNSGLGGLQDSVAILQRAIQYLQDTLQVPGRDCAPWECIAHDWDESNATPCVYCYPIKT